MASSPVRNGVEVTGAVLGLALVIPLAGCLVEHEQWRRPWRTICSEPWKSLFSGAMDTKHCQHGWPGDGCPYCNLAFIDVIDGPSVPPNYWRELRERPVELPPEMIAVLELEKAKKKRRQR
jgi:hypothetical protein